MNGLNQTRYQVTRASIVLATLLSALCLGLTLPPGASVEKPGYEPAYVNGNTVTINAIEVSQHSARPGAG